MAEFVFDCPQHFYDLNTPVEYNNYNSDIDSWFNIPHRFNSRNNIKKLDNLSNNNEIEEIACDSRYSSSSSSVCNYKILRRIEGKPVRLSRSSMCSSSVSTVNNRINNKRGIDEVNVPDSNASNQTQNLVKTTTSNQNSLITVAQPNKRAEMNKKSKSNSSSSQNKLKSVSATGLINSTLSSVRLMKSTSTIDKNKTSVKTNQIKKTNKQTTSSSSAKVTRTTDVANDTDILFLLKQHNQRFAPAPAYEPPRHSVREVRGWEKKTGKIWNKLTPQERELANDEITMLKKEGKLTTETRH